MATMRIAIGSTLLLAADAERDFEVSMGYTQLLRAPNKRDRDSWKAKFAGYSGKDFRRRFKVSRARFEWISRKIASQVEPSEMGKYMAFVSSGSYITSDIYLGVTLRWLAGSHFLDLEDLYGVEANSVYRIIKKTIGAMDNVLKLDPFNPFDIGQCTSLASSMYERSKQTVANCIGALDGMCVRIYKPRESEVGNPLHFLNRKGFF